jgi:hypothetical protein
MNITKAQYATDLDGNVNSVRATINGEVWVVPLDPANRHYAEILKQVKEGTLTIKEAE